MNTLLEPKTVEKVISRASALKLYMRPIWGTMNPTEMLAHCNSYNKELLKGDEPGSRPSAKGQFWRRLLALYISPKLKKGEQTEHQHNMKGKVSADVFDQQKEEFINLLRQFLQLSKPLAHIHPKLGYLTTKQWGIIAYQHIDHHLRQFGV